MSELPPAPTDNGVEMWETVETEKGDMHLLTWVPPDHSPQEYGCIDGCLFDLETANMVGPCEKCDG